MALVLLIIHCSLHCKFPGLPIRHVGSLAVQSGLILPQAQPSTSSIPCCCAAVCLYVLQPPLPSPARPPPPYHWKTAPSTAVLPRQESRAWPPAPTATLVHLVCSAPPPAVGDQWRAPASKQVRRAAARLHMCVLVACSNQEGQGLTGTDSTRLRVQQSGSIGLWVSAWPCVML